jgi:hypothetical protein
MTVSNSVEELDSCLGHNYFDKAFVANLHDFLSPEWFKPK